MDEATLAPGLLSTVANPDDGAATSMLRVFVLPVSRHAGDRDAVVLKMVGELCAYSADLVQPTMRRFVECSDAVVIDLTDLRFVDAAGLQLLNDLANSGDVIRLENVDHRLSRIFAIAGLDRLLDGQPGRAAS